MYNSADIAERIRAVAKSKNIYIKVMLINLGLSINTLSNMSTRGSFPKSDSLARIADYLGCSVDYLLGRNENDDTIFEDGLVIFHRGGKIIRRKFSEEEMECMERFIDFIANENLKY